MRMHATGARALSAMPDEVMFCMLRSILDFKADVGHQRVERAMPALLRLSRVLKEIRKAVNEFAVWHMQLHAPFHLWPAYVLYLCTIIACVLCCLRTVRRVTHACVGSVRSEVEQVKISEDTENGLLYSLHVKRRMDNLLTGHVGGLKDDLLSMHACLALAQQYRVRKALDAYLHVHSWRVVDCVVLAKSTSAKECICHEIPYHARRCSLLLEAVDFKRPENFVALDHMPRVRLCLWPVPVQAALDSFNRLLFLHRTTCTVCRQHEAKLKSIDACSNPADMAVYCALCKGCLKECFVKVNRGQSCNFEPCAWVLELEATRKLYFSRAFRQRLLRWARPKGGNWESTPSSTKLPWHRASPRGRSCTCTSAAQRLRNATRGNECDNSGCQWLSRRGS
jgi:hypothetical protein